MTTKVDGTNGVLQSYDYQVMTTGFSYTFAAGITNLIMNPAGTLATGTITMPASPADGMTITFSSTQTITALTVNGNSGQTVVGAPTTLTAGAVVVLVYRLSATTWITQVNTNDTGATGVPVINTFVSPGTWTKPATVKAIKVTVVGGGGNGGPATNANPGAAAGAGGGGGGGAAINIYPAPSLPGPQPYTVGTAGGTSSFGVAPITVVTATGGAAGSNANAAPGSGPAGNVGSVGGAGGAGSSGQVNMVGGAGVNGIAVSATNGGSSGGAGGNSFMGGGGLAGRTSTTASVAGSNGSNYGGGGGGSAKINSPGTTNGGTGATGVVIIEEFY